MKKIGRYDILEELGRGAMGVVYKAADPTIGRMVAIKLLSLEPTDDKDSPGTKDLFMREARAAGRLSHPGIVTIHDALEDPETQRSYIVMEFVSGRTLENVLLYGPVISSEKALDLIRQIAEALDYAHQQQIIHRDLKPANVLLTDEGHTKITDFGIAKIAARDSTLRTAAVMGTPAYMSPEQVTGGEVDARSDLFSMGILLYLMLTGQKPFSGDTAAVMFKIVYEDPLPPSQYKPELTGGHDYLALRALAKDPKKRYATAREFLDDLDDVQHGHPPRSEGQFPLSQLRIGERTVIARQGLSGAGTEGLAAAKKVAWLVGGMGAGVALLTVLLGAGMLIFRHAASSPLAPVPASASASPNDLKPAPPSSPSPTNPVKTAASPEPTPEASSKQGPTNEGREAISRPGTSQKRAPSRPTASRQVARAGVNGPSGKANPYASRQASNERPIELVCRYEVQEATLTVSGDSGILIRGTLRGRKKGGFLGIKGSFGGALTRSFTPPPGTRNLTVHAVSKDGSLDLSKTISLASARPSNILHVYVGPDQINLDWRARAHPNP